MSEPFLCECGEYWWALNTHMCGAVWCECQLKILYFDVYCINGSRFQCPTLSIKKLNAIRTCANYGSGNGIGWKIKRNWEREFYGGDTFSIIYGQCSIKGYFETLWIIFCVGRFWAHKFLTISFTILALSILERICNLSILKNSVFFDHFDSCRSKPNWNEPILLIIK